MSPVAPLRPDIPSPGTDKRIGLQTWSAMMRALYQPAMTTAWSIACADASDKSTGHRMRRMFVFTASRVASVEPAVDAD